MAGEWIKVERATPDKPEVLRIARELAIDRDAVFGKLMLVWMWFDANSVDGVVDGAVDADVDELVRQKGFASVMRSVKWLLDAPSGKCNSGLFIPNFDRHNGETAKKRALKNNRQARWRQSVDEAESTNASTREEKRREEKKVKEKIERSPKGSRLPPGWRPSELVEQWAKKERPELSFDILVAKFRDHWCSVPGARGRKLDWEATFRNFVRSEFAPRGAAPAPDYAAVIANLKD